MDIFDMMGCQDSSTSACPAASAAHPDAGGPSDDESDGPPPLVPDEDSDAAAGSDAAGSHHEDGDESGSEDSLPCRFFLDGTSESELPIEQEPAYQPVKDPPVVIHVSLLSLGGSEFNLHGGGSSGERVGVPGRRYCNYPAAAVATRVHTHMHRQTHIWNQANL